MNTDIKQNKKISHARNIGQMYDELIAKGDSHEIAIRFIADSYRINYQIVSKELGIWKRWNTTMSAKHKKIYEELWDKWDNEGAMNLNFIKKV